MQTTKKFQVKVSPGASKKTAANGGKSKTIGLKPKAQPGVVPSRLNKGGDMAFKGTRGANCG